MHLGHQAQIYEECFCRILSILRTDISVARSETEMLILTRQKKCKQRFPCMIKYMEKKPDVATPRYSDTHRQSPGP